VVHGEYAYWTNKGDGDTANPNGSVMRVPVAGGAAEILAQQQACPGGMAVDDTGVYWASFDTGCVAKLAK